jgi:hypothetical protein
MANNKQNKKKTKPRTKKRSNNGGPKRSNAQGSSNRAFGPVSTINTAPVAIGNSLRGIRPTVIHTADGCTVIGRDFAFTPIATGTSVTDWCMVGGMPLTPACMPSTALRSFCQLYNKFKYNESYLHFITSSATSSPGDIVFQHLKDSNDPPPDWTDDSFLPFVMSDALTVIGPQWTNHTMSVKPNGPFKSTNYGASIPNNQYSFGDVFFYAKNEIAGSVGYVLHDYNITFKELSVHPRAGIMPASKAMWKQISLTLTQNATINSTIITGTTATTGMGGTTIVAPVPVIGDVYRMLVNTTTSTFSATTKANVFKYLVGTTAETFTMEDGCPLYLVFSSTTSCYFFNDETVAFVPVGTGMIAGVTAQYAETLRGFMKYVGSVDPSQLSGKY